LNSSLVESPEAYKRSTAVLPHYPNGEGDRKLTCLTVVITSLKKVLIETVCCHAISHQGEEIISYQITLSSRIYPSQMSLVGLFAKHIPFFGPSRYVKISVTTTDMKHSHIFEIM
jgi:hypothetical protein